MLCCHEGGVKERQQRVWATAGTVTRKCGEERTVELNGAVNGLVAQVLAEHQVEQQRCRAQRAVRVEASQLLHERVHLGPTRPTREC